MHAAPLTVADGTRPRRSSAASSTIPAVDGRQLAATLFEPPQPARRRAPLTVIGAGSGGTAAATTRASPPIWPSTAARRSPSTIAASAARAAASLKGSQGAHARLVHPRRAGRARLGAAHLSRAADPLGRPQHGRLRDGLAHNNHLVARQLNVATLSGYWGRMARARALSRASADGHAGAADRARARLFAGRADGRRGHAGSGVPRVGGAGA